MVTRVGIQHNRPLLTIVKMVYPWPTLRTMHHWTIDLLTHWNQKSIGSTGHAWNLQVSRSFPSKTSVQLWRCSNGPIVPPFPEISPQTSWRSRIRKAEGTRRKFPGSGRSAKVSGDEAYIAHFQWRITISTSIYMGSILLHCKLIFTTTVFFAIIQYWPSLSILSHS